MDRTTESIAHFIGLFQIAAEEGRLRKSFEEIEQPPRKPDELGEPAPVSPDLQSPFGLKPYDPDLSYKDVSVSEHPAMNGVFGDRMLPQDVSFDPAPRFELPTMNPPAAPAGGGAAHGQMMPPSSVITVTQQSAWLQDDDVFGADADSEVTDTSDLHAAFDAMRQKVSAFSAFEPPLPTGDWAGFAEEAIGTIEAPNPDGFGLEIHARRGEDAKGTYIDGSSAEEIADWTDYLPAYVAKVHGFDQDDEDAALPEDVDEEMASPAPQSGAAGQQGTVQSGISTDGTAQAGTTGTGSTGTQLSLSGSGVGGAASPQSPAGSVAAPAAGSGSAGVQAAGSQSATTASSQAVAGTPGAAPGSSGTPGGVPAGTAPDHDISKDFEDWQNVDGEASPEGYTISTGANLAINEASIKMSWLDAPVFVVRGDYTNLQAISQVNVLVENDGAVANSPGTASKALNTASIVEEAAALDEEEQHEDALPQGWALARVTTDLVAINHVNQNTVATDFDWASIDALASSLSLTMGENMIVNDTFINEIGFYFDLVFVAGDMIEIDMISQMNLLLDSDKVEGAGAAAAALSAGGNLLYNEAVIKKTGIDEIVPMQSPFAEMAEDLQAGIDAMVDEVLADPLFAGTDILRVLQIDGDFVTLNLLEQSNMLGDSDEVHIGAAGQGAGAAVIAGQNALANLVTIEKFGLDSKVMVGGQTYDDAMLYQAELVENDAPPADVAMAPLVNEAIAFLADGVTVPETVESPSSPELSTDLPGHVDVVQGMLS